MEFRMSDSNSSSNSQSNIYYFDVPGIMCTSCKALIENNLNAKSYAKKVSVDVSNKTVKVIVQSGDKTSATKILQDIKACGDKFKSSTVKVYSFHNPETTHYYVVKNLSSEDCADKLKLFLENHPVLVERFKFIYETKGLKLELQPGKTLDDIKQALQKNNSLKHLNIEKITPPNPEESKKHLSKVYYKNAWINLLVGLPLWVISILGLIPSPLMPLGQLLGLGIGGITLGVMYVSGKSFYNDAWDQFWNHRNYNMNTLIAIGTGAAWIYSMMLVLYPWGFAVAALHYEFMAVNFILGILNMGKGVRESLQEKTRSQVKSVNDMFLEMQPQYAARVSQTNLQRSSLLNLNRELIFFKDIKKGDIIEVRKNERIPVEGVIVRFSNNEKETAIDQCTLSGEADQVTKKEHSEVASGSLNKGGTFYLQATRNGDKGNLYEITKLAQRNNTNELSMSKTIDKIAKYFVPSILVIAMLTGVGWFIWGPAQISLAVQSVLSVLLCACPCALGLATPITTNISVNKLFGQGIFVNKVNTLEVVPHVNVMVFDKTGTLTTPSLKKIKSFDSVWSEQKLLNYVTSLEASSNHPIAQSFQHNMGNKLGTDGFKEIEGGIEGIIIEDGKGIPIKFCAQAPVESKVQTRSKDDHKDFKVKWDKEGYTSLYVYTAEPIELVLTEEGEVKAKPIKSPLKYNFVGMIALEHRLNAEASCAILDLKNKNIEIYILSGDDAAPTEKVAELLHIPKRNVFSKKKPDEKAEIIEQIRKEKISKGINPIIAMVGDGVNDIKALNKADLSVAVGPWTPASISSDIAVHRLSQISKLMLVSNQAMRNIYQNLAWTGLYNTFSLLAATGLLYAFMGIVLNPIVASIGMAISSIVVVFNSNSLSGKIDKLLGNDDWKVNFTDTLKSYSDGRPNNVFDKETLVNSPVRKRAKTMQFSPSKTAGVDDSVEPYSDSNSKSVVKKPLFQ